MNYKKKRNNCRLDTYTVSKLLGIDEQKYIEVEQGYRNLEGELINKFMDIIDNAKNIRFNNKQLERDINEWIESGQAKRDIKATGYEQTEIAKKLNTSPSMLSKILCHPNNVLFSSKYRLYDFVKNPLNKNIEDLLKIEKEKNVKVEDKTIDENAAEEVENTKKDMTAEYKRQDFDNELETLKTENERLKKQLERYEKLIDRLE